MRSRIIAIIILLALLLPAAGASGKVITVGKDGRADHQSIQEAVDAAEEGDIIRVFNGSYQGSVVVNLSLSFLGNGSAVTSIIGDGQGSAVSFAADGISFRDFTVSGGSQGAGVAGILVEGSDCSLTENVFTDNKGSGIHIRNASRTAIANNSFRDNAVGLSLEGNTSSTLVLLNLFENNSEAAVDASRSQEGQLAARSNWWGDRSGPYNVQENPNGTGGEILGDVNFSAWLLSPPGVQIKLPKISSETDRPFQGQTVEFEITVPDGEEGVEAYFVDFGDGTNSNWTTKTTLEHRFQDHGDFQVRVKLRTDQGYESEWSAELEVEVKEDKVPFEPVVGLMITLVVVIFCVSVGLTILLNADPEEDPAAIAARAAMKDREEMKKNTAGDTGTEEPVTPEPGTDEKKESPGPGTGEDRPDDV